MEILLWLLLCYVVGTAIGYYMGSKKINRELVEKLLDDLIEQGFVKTREVDGEVELLRYWEEKE